MSRLVVVALVGALLLGGATIGTASAARPTPKLNGNVVGQAVQLLGKVAAIVQRDTGKCSKMAADLNGFAAANAGAIKRLNAAGASLTKLQRLQVSQQYVAYAQQIAQSVSRIGMGIAACYSNAGLKNALKALGG